MNTLHYKVIYRNGDKIPVEIANFYRNNDGKFMFEYCNQPKYEFPGFDKSTKKYNSDHLWEQISFECQIIYGTSFPTLRQKSY